MVEHSPCTLFANGVERSDSNRLDESHCITNPWRSLRRRANGIMNAAELLANSLNPSESRHRTDVDKGTRADSQDADVRESATKQLEQVANDNFVRIFVFRSQ